MHRILIYGLAAFGWASGLGAQAVPARDLWEFPLGAMYEPPALASEPGAGLWNPATIALRSGERFRFGVASLAAGSAQGVDGQLLSAAMRRSSGTTFGLSVARAGISGLVRTDTDPLAVGNIPYATWLVSVSGARELVPHLTVGAAVRWRHGRADQVTGDALAADFGAVLHDLPWRNARVALSSFLWRPGREIEDRPALLTAADFRLAGTMVEREVRAGVAYANVNRGAQEVGPFVSARRDRVEARVAHLRTEVAGQSVDRLRFGLALYYARFSVGVAREEGVSGLGAVYQFTLSSIIK
ncbi:hypothetical protein GAU_1716 [Gemmatimonas aurantiaca T-27]|uniref:Uncharacterized protein n=1 Tax=Gemmatimonas aurantiaca (strain DSM 14586 / JCM 11422 / NBRC 100505 / T-27) TaxID=379066 RepID=C1A948_GEMAT|nr:hypothetical protein [Gemmatimonas aurantiaca]BAH38758.1 hypothetical protein GAU_1716 [Gemmatimonas aurantiaca T-27]